MSAPRISGLAEIADRFDAFLVDQFGVIHDGRAAFPGAVECLRELKTTGKRVAVVSNSGKRAEQNATRLAGFGVDPSVCDAVVTSGEVARSLIAQRLASGALSPGAQALVVARDEDRSAIEGLDLAETDDGQAAELVLILGAAPESHTREGYARRLQPPAARGVPCVCANPDLRMYAAGGVSFGPGAIAADYAAAGGPVEWVGKPHPEIFRAALAALGDPAPERAVMIGDSAEHDCGGAAAIGLGWMLVEGGVYAGGGQVGLPDGPGWRIPRLVW